MQIIKFGGSSVGSAIRILAVKDIIKDKLSQDPLCLVVVSALSGTTDLLKKSAEFAVQKKGFSEFVEEIKNKHFNCIADLGIDNPALILRIQEEINNLNEKLVSISLLQDLTNKTLDQLLCLGEIFSSEIVASLLTKFDMPAEAINAREIIKTDNSYSCGIVDFKLSNELIIKRFEAETGVKVITGFVAESAEGNLITLGRGGSDYTASIIGAALNAKVIEIWTDVDGMYTANPATVSKAFPQAHLTFAEAMELSHFGAKVIYPPSIQPAMIKNIPILIKNSFNPSALGTEISNNKQASRQSICGITSIGQTSLLRLEGSGLVGVSGTASRLFATLATSKINVILITQASSEHTICFAVQPDQAFRAKETVDQEFALEIQSNLINPLVIDRDLSIISIVGENMRTVPGTAGKMFNALGNNGININAIAQGSSEINISAVIAQKDEDKALKVLHEEFFFPDHKTVNAFLIGTGLIGEELIKQIKNHSDTLATEHGHQVRVIGLANSRKMILAEAGIKPTELSLELLLAGQDSNLDEIRKFIVSCNLPNSLIVDCTASDEIASHYQSFLESKISVVTPNKKAQSTDYLQYLELQRVAAKRGASFIYETSVGAGLPVISSLKDLIKSGDQIQRIEAVLSGTLSFIFNSFDGSKSFSAVVLDAQKAGFTEPDPRDDLNGLDVARKILILARECGANLNLKDVVIENLVPENCRATNSTAEFFQLLQESDSYFLDKLSTAQKRNCKLCYIASFADGQAKVELKEVDQDHPFYNLSGSDNIISFTSDRYKLRPLVVKGPGAGAAVTAAGVFADIIRLAGH